MNIELLSSLNDRVKIRIKVCEREMFDRNVSERSEKVYRLVHTAVGD